MLVGRRAEGWKLVPRGDYWYVRFTHADERYFISTGERDPKAAAITAARVYSDVVSGKRRTPIAAIAAWQPLDILMAQWLATLDGILDVETVKTYERAYVRKHFLPWFERLDRVTEATIADYARKRLREVMRSTLQKELSALRGFLRWCREQGLLVTLPAFPELPKTARGVRVGTQRQHARPITPGEVAHLIAALPVVSTRGLKRFPVRARFVVAWATTLRPATLSALRRGVHYSPGDSALLLRDEDDKARRGREIPLTDAARVALDGACEGLGDGMLIFGRHDYRPHLAAAALAAGLPQDAVCAYDLRHARITDLIERSGNIPGVMHMSGHTQVSTLSRYTHPSRRAAEDVLRNTGSIVVQSGEASGAKEGT